MESLFPESDELRAEGCWENDEIATVAGEVRENLADIEEAGRTIVSLSLVPETAWGVACRVVSRPPTVAKVLRQLTTMDGEPGSPQPTLLTDFQIRQILAGYAQRLRLGDCVITASAGAGAFGEAFHGRKLAPTAPVLIQTLYPPDDGDVQAFLQKAARAAGELAALRHPLIAEPLEIGQAHGCVFVASSRPPGRSLRSFVTESIANGRVVSFAAVARIVRDIASVLEYLHSRRRCHGELCPETAYVDGQAVMLQNAGLAGIMTAMLKPNEEATSQQRQWRAWNASYVAPELRNAGGRPAPASDLFSLGAIFYYLLTGKPVAADGNPMTRAEERKIAEQNAISPRMRRQLRSLLDGLLSEQPSLRPTAAETIAATDEMLEELQIPRTVDSSPPKTAIGDEQLTVQSVDPSLKTALSTPPDSIGALTQKESEIGSDTDEQTRESKPTEKLRKIAMGAPQTDAQKCVEQGNAALAAGDLEQALGRFDLATRIDGGLWQAWYNRGLALRKLCRDREAADSFRTATKYAPRNPRTWFQMGVALATIGDLADAFEAFDLADWLGHPRAADACRKCKQELDRRRGGVGSADQIAKMLAEARSEAGKQRFDFAVKLFEKALSLDSSDRRAWYDKGVTHASLGQVRHAIECFERSVELAPDYGRAWYNLAVARAKLRRWDQAIAAFQRAADCGRPDAAKALARCKRLRDRSVRGSKPREDRTVFLDVRPSRSNNGEDSRGEKPHSDRGRRLAAERNPNEAIEIYDDALEQNPYDWKIWHAKAQALLALGESEPAANCLDRVLALNSACAEAWYERGRLFVEEARRSEAADCFRRALENGHAAADSALRMLESMQAEG